MPTYVSEGKLTSHRVDIDLLGRIEQYLLTQAIKTAKIRRENVDYDISITDDLGTETIRTISEYNLPLLSDSTKEVRIFLDGRSGENFVRVWISFNIDESYSRKKIEYSGNESVRETTLMINSEIERILKSYRTRYWIFGCLDYVKYLMPAITLFVILGIFEARERLSLGQIVRIVVFIALANAFLFVGVRIHPHTLFDSNRGRSYVRWHNWFYSSIVGFIIFDLVWAFLHW